MQTIGDRAEDSVRTLAAVNYLLLLAAVFLAGAPAVVAAAIAYSRRGETSRALASHLNYQIRVFWVAFALALAAGACFLAALLWLASGSYRTPGPGAGWPGGWPQARIAAVTLDAPLAALLAGAALFSAIGGVWLLIAPAVGLIRLASGRGMGHSPSS